MDVISLHQAGFTNAVASLGTALTPGHASLIKRYVKEVYLTYDSDEAGTKAALRAIPILKGCRDYGERLSVWILTKIRMNLSRISERKLLKNGLAEARNGFMFSLEVLERDYDMHSPEGKTDFMREAARRLGEFEEEIERNNYIEAVAQAYHRGI